MTGEYYKCWRKNKFSLEYIKKINQLYLDVSNSGDGEWAKHINTQEKIIEYLKFSNLVSNTVVSGGKLLDWGAQYGHISIMADMLGADDVVPFVVNPTNGVKKALNKNFKGKWKESSDSIKLGFKDESFDVVVSSGVLEHVQEGGGCDVESIKEIHRVLKNNGSFLLWKLPNASGISEIKSDILGKWSHRHRYTKDGVIELLENNGFKVKYFEYDGILPLSLAAYLRKVHLDVLVRFTEWLATKKPFSVFSNDFVIKAIKI